MYIRYMQQRIRALFVIGLWHYGRSWYVILSCFWQIQKVTLVCYYKITQLMFSSTHNPLLFTNSDISTYATLSTSFKYNISTENRESNFLNISTSAITPQMYN
jgi:hypothetical protein